MKYTKFIYTLLGIVIIILPTWGKPTSLYFKTGQAVTIAWEKTEPSVVHSALKMFCNDYQAVFTAKPKMVNATAPMADIIVGTIGYNKQIEQLGYQKKIDLSAIQDRKEAFLLKVTLLNGRPCLIVAGSDKRGTAYGILEVSRFIGVSPWVWWADVQPNRLQNFELEGDSQIIHYPSVEYRGIFLNDEDWGLTPWSYKTYEPSERIGQIGPKTHERIFELLLRLRANTFWPAMHECTIPFYFTPGNKEIADRYGIYIGTSHCEPMMRNTNGEWKTDGQGDYDYVNNRENVKQFWEERIKEVAASDHIYTLGMRGVHDGKMQGAKTIPEQKEVLTQVMKDQREMLIRMVKPEIGKIPQAFIPYKEVLDIYHAGLEVPEDITLIWCDDNYGYIRHFPDSTERKRTGGHGMYYHISYWGRPHDYLWLSTTHPALIYNQLKQAYESGIQKIWMLNVGDIKPAEYQIELFMDLAWNIEDPRQNWLNWHLNYWLKQNFGEELAPELVKVMQEYYRLAYICKPEFLGHTRVEETNPQYKIISDLPWSEEEIRNRLSQYKTIANQIAKLGKLIPSTKQDAWMQLIKYPVLAANEMNKKLLYAQLARHNKADWRLSRQAYDSIVSLTQAYNACNQGKWDKIMDFCPRRLPVFEPVAPSRAPQPLTKASVPRILFNATGYSSSTGKPEWAEGLGHEGKAIKLPAGSSITFQLKLTTSDSVEIQTALVPTHPVKGKLLRYQIHVDDGEPQVVEYQTKGRSEEWKLNVLCNQALRTTKHLPNKKTTHTLTIKAIDEGVIVDQVRVY